MTGSCTGAAAAATAICPVGGGSALTDWLGVGAAKANAGAGSGAAGGSATGAGATGSGITGWCSNSASAVIATADNGLKKRYPWANSHPSLANSTAWLSDSTPSATVRQPRLRAMSTIVLANAWLRNSSTDWTNSLSILMMSSGRLCT